MRARAAAAAVLVAAMTVWHTGAHAATEYEDTIALATDLNGSGDSRLKEKVLDWLRGDEGDSNLVMDPDGNTFTHYAATNVLSILREALLRGGDPKRENKFGATPLHFSASQFRGGPGPEAIKLLMLAGADASIRDRRGGTVLHTLYEGVETNATLPVNNLGHPTIGGGKRADILQALLTTADASPNATNNDGDTPLMMLVRTRTALPDQREQVSLILRHGADPNTRNNAGATPLIEALSRGDNSRYGLSDVTEIVNLLLRHGADPNLRGGNGDTPLIAAAKHKDDIGDEMQALLAGGADPCLTDRNGKLAYDHTEKGSDGRQVLDEAGGNPDASNSKCGGGAEEQEAKLDLSQGQRKRIQSCLKTRGFDPGKADGSFGNRTRWAISAWQEERGGERRAHRLPDARANRRATGLVQGHALAALPRQVRYRLLAGDPEPAGVPCVEL